MEAVYDALTNSSLNFGFFNAVGLPRLAIYWPRVLVSAGIFHAIYQLGDYLLPLIFPKTWGRASKVDKYQCRVRIVSGLHAVYAITKGLVIIANSKLRADPLFGTDFLAESTHAVTLGFFLWDVILTYKHFHIEGLQMMTHAVLAFGVYLLSYMPLLQYYGACFIMFEISTIFLHLHFILDKTNCQGAVMFYVNGMALISSFFFVRIVFGTILTLNVWKAMSNSTIPINPLVKTFVRVSNLTLLCFSYNWFRQIMVETKRCILAAEDMVTQAQAQKEEKSK